VHRVSTPPFIAIPMGVAVVVPPESPLPALLADPMGTPRGDVVLVPGFTGSKEDFIALVRPLADLGWRVAGVDLPGQGGTAALGGRHSHTEQTLASAVLSFLDWFAPDRPVHVVGHSMGGLATRDLVPAHPHRLASWTAMSSGPAAIPTHAHASLDALRTALDVAPLELIWQQKEAADRAGGWDPGTEEVAEFCRRRFISNDPAALYDAADLLEHAPDRCSELAAAGVPLGVIAGEIDDAWPMSVQREMARRLGARFIELPGLGHNPGVEDPELTARAIDRICTTVGDPERAGSQV
jgi:pimeloyl-ACP methyl ester carboxylesterase